VGDLLRPSSGPPPALLRRFLAFSLRESRKIIGKAYPPRHGGAILVTRTVTTAMASEGLDTNKDGVYSREELVPLAKVMSIR
jgi:hypothetical protein